MALKPEEGWRPKKKRRPGEDYLDKPSKIG